MNNRNILSSDLNEDDEDERHVYAWEQGTVASQWMETKDGVVDSDLINNDHLVLSKELEKLHKAKLRRMTPSIRRGLIRYLLITLDCSKAAEDIDYRPSRIQVCKDVSCSFITSYFDQNPISQLGVAISRDRIVEQVTELSGNPTNHISKLKNIKRTSGLASLQNILQLAISTLRHVPEYGHRELLILYSSISTCDPGDIFKTIQEAKKLKICINCICLAGEIYICKFMADETGGSFSCATDSIHLQELIMRHVIPPPELLDKAVHSTAYTDFVYMGFPKRTFQNASSFLINSDSIKMSSASYVCPRCNVRTEELPADCKVCGLQLNSSANIARSYHHLFPVSNYQEVLPETKGLLQQSDDQSLSGWTCQGCLGSYSRNNLQMKCTTCQQVYCIDCDLFIHESLHNCPSCK